jgi:nitrite reductase/ring-hydroxylating ferredoxin subunit
MRVFNTTHENVYRVLIMMEDWKPGHYLEVDGVGVVNWRAGDYYMWENFCPHAASNIGIDDRYSLQITGELIG